MLLCCIVLPGKMVGAGPLLEVSVGDDSIVHVPEPGSHEVCDDHINGVVPPGHHQHGHTRHGH